MYLPIGAVLENCYSIKLTPLLLTWDNAIEEFYGYLLFERAFSKNTIVAYLHDITLLQEYILKQTPLVTPLTIKALSLQKFIQQNARKGISANTHHRLIKAIKCFYKFMIYADHMDNNPADQLSYPKLPKKIPQVLHLKEIDLILNGININSRDGLRNRAILETLYACGLRATELCNFKLSDYHPIKEYIRVIGKGEKERDIPIGQSAIMWINRYIVGVRNRLRIIQKGHENIVFISGTGRRLNRSKIGTIVTKATSTINLNKKITPHTFRHSFASHLIDGGATVHAVKDMLGHKSLTSTEIYVNLKQDFLRDTLECYHPRFK